MLSVIAICSAQESPELVKLDNVKARQDNIEALLRQIGEMGMLLENYRNVILNGITEATDLCAFVESLSDFGDDKISDGNFILSHNQLAGQRSSSLSDRLTPDAMAVRVYRNFFRKLNDPVLKSQMFSSLENHIDNCFSLPTNQLEKRDKGQQVRFHSWGGKRNRGQPKVVIRTPFHAWGGKRSGKGV
jgi:hypothetical protein